VEDGVLKALTRRFHTGSRSASSKTVLWKLLPPDFRPLWGEDTKRKFTHVKPEPAVGYGRRCRFTMSTTVFLLIPRRLAMVR
jgi:hypothetical protein